MTAKQVGDLIKSGDAAQYHAEPHANYEGEERGVMPSVHLLWMTPDPLGAVAAMAAMYEGKVVRHLDEVTDAMRRKAFEDVQQTHLKAPLEAVKLHFMVEGVDRAFTHQHVRQRTAVYAQESMRFAIPGDLTEATTLPPSLQGTSHDAYEPRDGGGNPQRWRDAWDTALHSVDAAYHLLVETGMPAEEARGLLPHATATRLNYVTDLRNLSDHAGNRLCTQAQFHWRVVYAKMMQAIAAFPHVGCEECGGSGVVEESHEAWAVERLACPSCWDGHTWQFEALAKSALFRPVCYQLRYCPFKASFDRTCTIRERVEKLGGAGVPSEHWNEDQVVPGEPVRVVRLSDGDETIVSFKAEHVQGIQPNEWLANPNAARS